MQHRIHKTLSLLLVLATILSVFTGVAPGARAQEVALDFVIEMADSYADGWSGCGIDVYEGNTLVTTATVSTGASAQVSVPYTLGKIYSFRWVKGSYATECSFKIRLGDELLVEGTGDQYLDGEDIYVFEQACSHQYNEVVIFPTCTQNGYTNHICTLCGKSYTTDETVPTGHRYEGNNCANCDRSVFKNYGYQIQSNGTCTILIYFGSETELTIPSQIQGYPVTTIGATAFSENDTLTSVTIPDGVTTIGEQAFYKCSKLTDVTLADSVTTIGNKAFYGCSNLAQIALPDSVTTIGEYAFKYCTNLTNISIPEGISSIGAYAFENCNKLVYHQYANGYYLGNETNPYVAFMYGSYSFRGTIHPQTKHIGALAFYKKAFSGTLPDGLTSIGPYAFQESTLGKIIIPGSVTSIGDGAFYQCSNLSIIEFPESVASIGASALQYCSKLTDVIMADGVTTIGGGAFANCSNLTNVTLPDSVITIGHYPFTGCAKLSYTIYEGAKYLGNKSNPYVLLADVLDDSVTGITVHPQTKLIGSYAFHQSQITDISLPEGVVGIGTYAFAESRLSSVHLPNSVTRIESYAFSGYLTSITIPESVTYIQTGAFEGCNNLTNITVDPKNPVYSSDGKVLYNKDQSVLLAAPGVFGDYTIRDTVVHIGSSAFKDCYYLRNVTIPNGVVSIGGSAFFGINYLQSVTIPDSVISIGPAAFRFCKWALEEITIPDSVVSIGWGVFSFCEDLSKVTFSANLSYIGAEAFDWCDSSPTLTFRGAAPYIGENAFYYAGKVTAYYPEGEEGWTQEKIQSYPGGTWIPYTLPETTYTVSGKLTSFGSATGSLKAELWQAGVNEPVYAAQISNGSYRFEAVRKGSYTLLISMDKSVSRSYAVTVSGTDVTLDVKINPLGDITGDGKINLGDVAKAYGHARGSGVIANAYAFSCGDINGDGKINMGDVAKIYAYTKGIGSFG